MSAMCFKISNINVTDMINTNTSIQVSICLSLCKINDIQAYALNASLNRDGCKYRLKVRHTLKCFPELGPESSHCWHDIVMSLSRKSS